MNSGQYEYERKSEIEMVSTRERSDLGPEVGTYHSTEIDVRTMPLPESNRKLEPFSMIGPD